MHPPASELLGWYDRHRRVMPWRGARDPYRIWLSEVMLQQTTVAAVEPRYRRFLDRFPDVEALAAAPWEAVAAEWAGLGYYARARNLHAAARAVVARGGFPGDEAGLRALPGIGAYTAAAVAAIAFNQPAVPVDGNVERVTARVFDVRDPLPGSRARLAVLARGFLDQALVRERPGDFAQALFDLGATLCTPRRPACALCPWNAHCAARAAGVQDSLPAKAPKAARAQRFGLHFLLRDREGRMLLRQRPPSGLLGGMAEIPGTPWRLETPWTLAEALPQAPVAAAWRLLPGTAQHGFTHMELLMRLAVAEASVAAPPGCFWLPAEEARATLPTAMRRLLALAEGGAGARDDAGANGPLLAEPASPVAPSGETTAPAARRGGRTRRTA
ncbi:A/G-specific adenine glycosylase [Roseomonas elaeocarpi]|uniref:Adenine DNA glycosylase n=1 Tax=Roseomonas elaeocarpi TaxID=907779 RepID=A0ABV6JVG8_9PROT